MYHIGIGQTYTRGVFVGERHIGDVDDIELVESDDVPKIIGDENAGSSNKRSLSGTRWEYFCRRAGLMDLFGREGTTLFQSWPGVVELRGKHVEQVDAALADYRAKHPDAIAGFTKDEVPAPGEERLDATLARLVWLAYWMRWAVCNCDRPGFRVG